MSETVTSERKIPTILGLNQELRKLKLTWKFIPEPTQAQIVAMEQ